MTTETMTAVTMTQEARRLAMTTPSNLEIEMTRSFQASRERVFDAFTKPDLVRAWMGTSNWPMAYCRIDLRVGGTMRYVWRNAEGTEMGLTATLQEIDAPARIVHTELFDEDWTGGETLVTTTFTESDGLTTVRMTIRYASKESRDAVLASPMEQGVAENFDNLEKLLEASK